MKNNLKIYYKECLIDEINEEMKCQKCKLLMKSPLIVDCNHTFCEECLLEITNCPIDEEEITSKILVKKTKSEIENLKIKCPNNEKCKWENTVKEFDEHLIKCEYMEIKCPNNCGEKELKDNIKDYTHTSNCPNFFKPCVICGKKVKNCDMNIHLYENFSDHFYSIFDILKTQTKKVNYLVEESVTQNKNINSLEEEKKYLIESIGSEKYFQIKLKSGGYIFLNSIGFYANSTELFVNNIVLNKEHIEELCFAIKFNKNLKKINFLNCNLNENFQFKNLSNAIKQNNSIEKLILIRNNLGCDFNNIKELSNLIASYGNIKELLIVNNKLGYNNKNLKLLSSAITKNKNLEILVLSDIDIDVDYLIKVYIQNTISDIDYSVNYFYSYNNDIKPILETYKDHNKNILFGKFPQYWDIDSNVNSKKEILKSFAEFLNNNFWDIKLYSKDYNVFGDNINLDYKYLIFSFNQGLNTRYIGFTDGEENIKEIKKDLIEMVFDFKFAF